MIGALDQIYSRLLEGFTLLLRNPIDCAAVGLLQNFAALLVLAIFVQTLIQSIATFRTNRAAEAWSDPRVLDLLSHCSRSFSTRRVPKLMIAASDAPHAFTAGYLRPSIHLSRELAEALDDAELRAVLCHELAHVERRDNAAAWAVRSLSVLALGLIPAALALELTIAHETLHFGSSNAKILAALIAVMIALVWRFLGRPAIALREVACDDRAIEVSGDPLALAGAIAKTWKLQRASAFRRWNGAHSSLVFDTGAETRIRRLMQDRSERGSGLRVIRVVAAVLCICCIMFVSSYHVRSSQSDKPPLRWSGISPP